MPFLRSEGQTNVGAATNPSYGETIHISDTNMMGWKKHPREPGVYVSCCFVFPFPITLYFNTITNQLGVEAPKENITYITPFK